MGDRTYMQLTVLECERKNAAAVLTLLKDHDFASYDASELMLGERYEREEASLGTLTEDLAYELAPLCSFVGWEDPKYEHEGRRVTSLVSDPDGFRLRQTPCFSDGDPVVGLELVRKTIKDAPETLPEVLGFDREQAIAELQERFTKTGPVSVVPYAYVVLERQNNPNMAIRYPDAATAEWALDNSFFVDSLCQEDCLDAYTAEAIDPDLREEPRGLEEVVPPDDDTSMDGSPRPASLDGWEDEGINGA